MKHNYIAFIDGFKSLNPFEVDEIGRMMFDRLDKRLSNNGEFDNADVVLSLTDTIRNLSEDNKEEGNS